MLSGIAPEIYGTGHARRAPIIREILSHCDLRLVPITDPPDQFWNGQGKSFLSEIAHSVSPALVVLDARDLDPSPLLQYCSVLAVDNQSRHRKKLALRSSDSSSSPAHSSGADAYSSATGWPEIFGGGSLRKKSLYLANDGFPIIYYDTLLPGCNLKTSVRRYLGPPTQPGLQRSSAGKSPMRNSPPRKKGLVFYAGSAGFIADSRLNTLDRVFYQVFGDSYMRIGGSEPSVAIHHRARLDGAAYGALLEEAEFFLGYYGLSLYQAAAAGCAVWGLMPGHAYHDDLICKWSIQGGGPVLHAGPELDLPLNPGRTSLSRGAAPRGASPEGASTTNILRATESEIKALKQLGSGWKETGDSAFDGAFAFRAALRALKRALPARKPGQ
ncbi:MAG: hypothetical protein CMN76_00315 [Spirochaetaceae bacterium]|nr:hypothetical protein [Spirochaetaceae bacterium]